MGFLRILGGAMIGVGAVAAVPFTGGGSLLAGATLASSLAGAGAIAAAVSAGTAGAIIADSIGDKNDKKHFQEGEKKGEVKAKAEYSIKLEKLLNKIKDIELLEKIIFAMVAVGISCANSDGNITDNEKKEISDFCLGVSQIGYSESLQEKIQKFIDNPPNIKEAYELVKNVAQNEEEQKNFNDIIINIIELTIHADGEIHQKEKEFLNSWKRLHETQEI